MWDRAVIGEVVLSEHLSLNPRHPETPQETASAERSI